jgi:hypothetical protein
LRFEHLIQVNDPDNPLIEPVTHAQLWEGLVLRARQPQLFVPGLEGCTILAHTGNVLMRELHYGAMNVRDRVTLTPPHSVRYDIQPADAYAGGSLTMTIEEPEAGQLFLRFEYQTTLPDPADDEDARQTAGIVKSAYYEADKDTVRLIRQLTHGHRNPGALH